MATSLRHNTYAYSNSYASCNRHGNPNGYSNRKGYCYCNSKRDSHRDSDGNRNCHSGYYSHRHANAQFPSGKYFHPHASRNRR